MKRSYQILNSFGLLLGIIGAIILFYYGPPQPSFQPGVAIVLEDNTVLPDGKTTKQHSEETTKLRENYEFWSKVGFIFITASFACQLAATWMPARDSH